MAYDERLAKRVGAILKGKRALVEKKMFGGLAYLSNGKMFAGILKKDLVVRVGPQGNDQALKAPPPHEANGFHGQAYEGIHLRESWWNQDSGAITEVAHEGAELRRKLATGETEGLAALVWP